MDENLRKALTILDQNGVVGMPTETVYGLAARIDRAEGLLKIFSVKQRPFFDPLIVHVSSIEQAKTLTDNWPKTAQILAEKFWPGPLTLVLPKNPLINEVITSGLETVGLRCPSHPVALALIKAAGPLAAPSANRFGHTSPTQAQHVRTEFKDQVFVLDGGACEVGIESTVLAILKDGTLSVLRKGAVTPSMIAQALADQKVTANFTELTEKRLAPGQMKHHYMPDIPLIIASAAMTSEAITMQANQRLRDLPDEVDGVKMKKPTSTLTLAKELKLSADPAIAARELYAELRKLSASGADHLIFKKDLSIQGEAWDGLLDRLTKAASLIL